MREGAKSYKTAGAFRAALETRLQTRAREKGTDLQRLRRQVAFDRFLARMFSKGPKATYPWVLKGGYAMELRMHSARTTKDIGLTLHDGTRLSRDPKERGEHVRAMLQEAAATRFDDYFERICLPWLFLSVLCIVLEPARQALHRQFATQPPRHTQ